MEDDQHEHEQHEHEESFIGRYDICQQLMDRYAKSSATQHRHLLATAAAMRSLLAADSLPLSAPAYFAAAISSAEENADSPHDASAAAALLSFLAIVLPLVPPRGIETESAAEAAAVITRMLAEGQGLGAASVRCGVKCLGVLVGFCDLEDWDSVKLAFETLMKFSLDKRPKVRRCSQECLEKAFKSINCSAVVKESSKLVMSLLKSHMPLAVELSSSRASSESKEDASSEMKNVEVLHMLNMLKLIVPFLSMKTRSKAVSKLNKLMKCQFSVLTRHIFKIMETCFENPKSDVIALVIEDILVSLCSYVSLGDKNPSDTIVTATTLLKRSLDILRDGESISHSKNLCRVFNSAAGLLTSEASIASHTATILKELINNHVDSRRLSTDCNQPCEAEGTGNIDESAIKSLCVVLENELRTSDGKPNENILGVISALFLKLGGISYDYMKTILLKLADAMTLASGEKYNSYHLESCIGSAVIAMGPEMILTEVPITLSDGNLTCSNVWLVPILKDYVVGASLEYYMQYVLRLSKSFREASRQVKKTSIGQNLQDHAQALWGLLPSFCRYPTDLHQNVGPLAEVLIKFLKKKDSLMHENVAVSLQVLVNQNKMALNQKTNLAGSLNSFEVRGLLIESNNLPAYSKKIATKNMKALASYSTALLKALTDLFIDSPPAKRSILKDAIGCLSCITDSYVTKKILFLLFERFGLINNEGEFIGSENGEDLTDSEKGNVNTMDKDAERCIVMELASSLVGGAKEDLIDLIYNFIKHTFQVTDGNCHQQAYHTLSRVLEEHPWVCTSQSNELIDLLLGCKPPTDNTDTLRCRFACFHPLLVHLLKIDSEEQNEKAFLIVNEIIISLKDSKEEETRKVAYDVLLRLSSSLRDTSSCSDVSDAPYQKLISMIMGYLSGASPRVKSGAVSALSMLIYSDASICLSVTDLIPTLLPLLQGKSLEVIKSALGFVKVLVSCLQARDLQNLLSSIVKGVLPWSSVSRNHFRSKVTVIMEILIRKCGISAVESVIPDRYKSFVKSVVESRQTKNSKDTRDIDSEAKNLENSTDRREKRKRNDSNSVRDKMGSPKLTKRTENNKFSHKTGSKESNNSMSAGGARRNFGARQGRPESSRRLNRKNFDGKKGPRSSNQKRKMNMGTKDGGFRKPGSGSTFRKPRKFEMK